MNHKKNILSIFIFLIFSTIFMHASDHEVEKESFLGKINSLTSKDIQEYLKKNPKDWSDVNRVMKENQCFHLQLTIRNLYWSCQNQIRSEQDQDSDERS